MSKRGQSGLPAGARRRPVGRLRDTGNVSLVLLLVICLAACRGEAAGTEPIAHVGDHPISPADLESYFELNLLSDGNAAVGPEEADRVKSRLLDALIDEKTLLLEAERRGIQVSDLEVEGYLESEARDDLEEGGLPDDRRRLLVRRRLMIGKLQDAVAERQPPASEDDVRDQLEGSGGSRRLRLRALRIGTPQAAAEVAQQIAAGGISFDEAVAKYGSSPDQGAPVEMSWEGLPKELQAALGGMKPGQVSRPVEFSGETFIFRLESWLTDPAEVAVALTRRAQEEAERQRRKRIEAELLQRLREQTPVRIHESRLPFRYVPEEDA